MALTMTRTRTQTALTKLATMIANVHGELEFVEGLLQAKQISQGKPLALEVLQGLESQRLVLIANRDALYTTLKQFNPRIDPSDIVAADGWRTRLGSKSLGKTSLLRRYMKSDFSR